MGEEEEDSEGYLRYKKRRALQKYFPNFPDYFPDELSNFFLTFLILQPRIGEDLFRSHP